VTTPTPSPEERANGWRGESPSLLPDFTVPGDPGSPTSLSSQPPVLPAVGRAFIPAPPFPRSEWAVSAGELFAALGVAVVVALAGFPLGWLWSAVAPHTPVQMISEGAVLSQPEQEQMIADEGWYVFLTIAAGVLAAALAWAFLRRYRGWLVTLGLGLGGVVSGSIAGWFGHRIGLAHFRDLVAHAPVGTNFLAPVSLRVKHVGWWHHVLPYARGDVLSMAIAAILIYLLLVAFSPHPSLREADPPSFALVGSDGYPEAAYSLPVHGDIEPPISSDS
jgi:hypothetical protein